jgi:dTDP-4-amino-4,6-dideoxygalactose transaminase
VDIDPATCNIDPGLIERKITPRTKAILPTHLYGFPCAMGAISALAEKYGLSVIEDCVQATGAEYGGRKVGSIGDAAYFGFGVTKNMPLLGGGMVVAKDQKILLKIREEVSSGRPPARAEIFKRTAVAAAMKVCTHPAAFTLSLFPLIYLLGLFGKDIAGDIFSEKRASLPGPEKNACGPMPEYILDRIGAFMIKKLDELNDKRIFNAGYILEHVANKGGVSFPFLADKNVFTSFPIRCKNRRAAAGELLKRGVDTTAGYMEAFGRDCPYARKLQEEILHIPVYPSLSVSDLSQISGCLQEIINKLGL